MDTLMLVKQSNDLVNDNENNEILLLNTNQNYDQIFDNMIVNTTYEVNDKEDKDCEIIKKKKLKSKFN